MKNMVMAAWIGLVCVLPLSGRAENQEPSIGEASGEASALASQSGATSGTVIETMNSGGYTYVHVDAGEKKIWAAAPPFEVSVGDQVIVPPGAAMRDFHSKTLDRTFETIYFQAGIQVAGIRNEVPGSGSKHAGSQPTEPTVALDLSGIAKAEGGKTIAEILDAGPALSGQEIAVRGRVAKFVPQIMGTNFLHLSDGTTSSGGGSDLTVTTNTAVEVGALVLVRGIVTTDKDFGYGYKYDLIIENANVTEE